MGKSNHAPINSNARNTRASLAADRNRWFYAFLVFSLIIAYLFFDNQRLRGDTSKLDVVWVKVYPDGSSDIEVSNLDNKRRIPDFFTANINRAIADFIKFRFGRNRYTIEDDFGLATVFMSAVLQREFTSDNGFNAHKVALDKIKCGQRCADRSISIRNIKHYERFDNSFGSIYRTDVFISETDTVSSSQQSSNNSIVNLEWRILTKEQILNKYPSYSKDEQLFLKYMRSNPVNLEVLKYTKLLDPSNVQNNIQNDDS